MSKVEAINDKSYSPRVFLAEMIEQVDGMESILIIVKDQDEVMRIAYSHLTIQELCFFHRILDDHIKNKMEYLVNDAQV